MPRPIIAGGTGATSAIAARDNLDAEASMYQVTNYNAQVWEAGSFYSIPGAVGAPTADAFLGICIGTAQIPGGIIMLEVFSIQDATAPVKRYYREYNGTTWGPWVIDQVSNAGGVWTQLSSPVPTTGTLGNIRLGNSTSQFNQYFNTTHSFFNLDASLTYARLDAAGCRLNGRVSLGADIRAAGYNGYDQVFVDLATSSGLEIIGTTSGVAGVFIGFANNLTAPLGAIMPTGAAPGTGVLYTTASDGRLKEDLQPFTRSGEILDALKVFDFRWISTQERGVGVIAQEAVVEFPDAVSKATGADGETIWGVDYSKFVPLLLEEVQRLRQRTSLLETQMAALEAKIAELEGKPA